MTSRSTLKLLALLALTCGCSSAAEDPGGVYSLTPDQDAAPGDDAMAEAAPPAPEPYPLPAGGGTADDGLARLNEYRKLAGLEAVTGNNDAAHACDGHLDYLIAESKLKGKCFLSHTEDNPSNPFYSVENEQAGINSVIACGFSSAGEQSLPQAVDLWINSLYHRLPLLETGLMEVGYASKQGYNCINYRPGTQKLKAPEPVVWPAAEMVDVPTDFVGFEVPCPTKPDNPLASNGMDCEPSGFIVTASWFNWGGFSAVQDALLLEDATNTPVPLLVWFADGVIGHDPLKAQGSYTPGTISLVPESSLAPNTRYRIEITAAPGGKATTVVSAFTTGNRSN